MARTISVHERVLPGRQRADLFATITAGAERIKPYKVTSPTSDSLLLTWRRTPTWAWVLALIGLLVLLLGLLFLLVKTTDVITVRAENVEDDVKVSVVGTGSAEMVRFPEGVLDLGDSSDTSDT
jgi:hypothetical protein